MGWVFGLCWLCFGMLFPDPPSGSGFLRFRLLALVWSVGDFFWFGIFLGLGGSCELSLQSASVTSSGEEWEWSCLECLLVDAS